MSSSSIRRFILTLITGYLAIFGIQRLPYDFENQWLVLIPVLIAVYIITVWLDGIFFDSTSTSTKTEINIRKDQSKSSKKGFGN
tara:strand:+ start:608 stop:859 length:252 start_codon:yes stop_codon:yes gene_type:complete